MSPALERGDHVLVERLSYIYKTPQRGDIIAFVKETKDEPVPGKFHIRRIVGVSGDKVRSSTMGRVFVNDSPVERPLSEEAMATHPNMEAFTFFEVPDKACYLLEDNSQDIMELLFAWRYTRLKHIQGRVLFRYWPLGKMGWVR